MGISETYVKNIRPIKIADTVNKSVTGGSQNLSDSQFSFFKDYYPMVYYEEGEKIKDTDMIVNRIPGK